MPHASPYYLPVNMLHLCRNPLPVISIRVYKGCQIKIIRQPGIRVFLLLQQLCHMIQNPARLIVPFLRNQKLRLKEPCRNIIFFHCHLFFHQSAVSFNQVWVLIFFMRKA